MYKTEVRLIITLIVSMGMVMSNVSCPTEARKIGGGERLAYAIQKQEEQLKEKYKEAVLMISEKEWQAREDKEKLDKKIVVKDKKGNKKYVDYYGGAYIDEDENLIVQFTKRLGKMKFHLQQKNLVIMLKYKKWIFHIQGW